MNIRESAQKRLDKMPEGNSRDFVEIVLSLYIAIRFAVTRLAVPFRIVSDSRRLGIYRVIFGKNEVRVCMLKSLAEDAIQNRAEHQAALQYVWHQVKEEVALVPAYNDIKVPDLHVWRNVDKSGDYVDKIKFHRDATSKERRRASFRPFRDGVSGLYKYVTGS